MFGDRQQTFGRRLASVRRRFSWKFTDISLAPGTFRKIVDPADNRVYLAFINNSGGMVWRLRPKGAATTLGFMLTTTLGNIVELEIDKHYSLVIDGWEASPIAMGGTVSVVEVTYTGV